MQLVSLWNRYRLWIVGFIISAAFLPVEGEFYVSLMGANLRIVAYTFCLALDFAAEVCMSEFVVIQRTSRGSFSNWKHSAKRWRLSWFILVFVLLNLCAGWGASFQQMRNFNAAVPQFVHALNALIQPLMLLGIAYTHAVQSGRFDEQVKSTPVQQVDNRAQGKPHHDWWLHKLDSLDGRGAQLNTRDVQEMIEAEWTGTVSSTTLYNWAKEAKERT